MTTARFTPGKVIFVAFFVGVSAVQAQSPSTNASTGSSEATTPSLRETYDLISRGDFDGAIVKVDAALQADPKNVQGYLLRGFIYGQEKLWVRSQQDYETALGLAPNMAVIKFDLAELNFRQKTYENARPGFVAVEGDPDIGDLAAYKVFLCDLLTQHEDVAAQELAAFNQAGTHPSYYYANAAWDLTHDNVKEGIGWLNSAAHIYNRTKNSLYRASLNDLAALHAPFVTFETKQGKKYEHVQATLEDTDLRVQTQGSWISVPLAQLPDDLSMFPRDWQNRIAAQRSPNTDTTGIQVSMLATKQGQKYENVSVFVEDADLRVRTADGFVSIPFEQLPDNLSNLPADLQKQIGLKRAPATDVIAGIQVPTLTTVQGQKYENVNVIVEDTDLRVHTPDGWISIPLAQLPDDLSTLPVELQNQISLKRAATADAVPGIPMPLLTTKQGSKYENVDIIVEDTGLRVHTATGWINLPFEQLPDDLSAFPTELRQQIASKRPSSSDIPTGIPVPILTTKQSQKYENVSVFVENEGLRFLSVNGWINIPFAQVPDDLSTFPIELQKQITLKRPQTLDVVAGIPVSTLTTKQGQTYTHIEVFVENAGLRFHTATGWISLPFEQLPGDLSTLPPELQKQIALKRAAVLR